MTYLVLARKWRPRSFDTLVGQDHVVRALTHALATQRLHHAWLFTGTRGVGKTTLSRILAKSLNCEQGITATPCDTCRACVEIDSGRFVDYVELDAASNRGVDEMTQLLEQAVYAPSSGRFKVYMIDEVHMLTGHAFNAMLKTLEEPPAHVKFILATTDPQKIPVTVLSRCLQFNLKQMAPESIVTHLQEVLAQEDIPFQAPALRLIAQAASGSMRDALSLTDQAIAYSAGNLTVEAMQGMLGTIDQRYLVRLLQALAAGSGAEVLKVADELATRGLSYSGALADLAILLSRVAIQQRIPGALDSGEPLVEEIVGLAELMHPDLVQLFYSVAVHSRDELSLAPDEYAGFVMACLRMLALAPQAEPADANGTSGGASGGDLSGHPQGEPGGVVSAQASGQSQDAEASDRSQGVAPGRTQDESEPARQLSEPARASAPITGTGAALATPMAEVASVTGKPAQPDQAFEVVQSPASADTAGMRGGEPAVAQGAASPGDAFAAHAPIDAPAGRNASSPLETAAAPNRSGRVHNEPANSEPVNEAPANDEPAHNEAAHHEPANDESTHEPAQGFAPDDIPAWEDIPIDDDAGQFEPYVGDDDDAPHTLADDTGGLSPSAPGLEAATAFAPERPKLRSPKLKNMNAKAWPALAAQLPVTGLAAELARQSEWLGVHDDQIRLRVAVRTLAATAGKARLCTVLSEHFGTVVQLDVEFGATGEETAHAVAQAERAARQKQAEQDVQQDPVVQALINEFGAQLVPGTVKAVFNGRAV